MATSKDYRTRHAKDTSKVSVVMIVGLSCALRHAVVEMVRLRLSKRRQGRGCQQGCRDGN